MGSDPRLAFLSTPDYSAIGAGYAGTEGEQDMYFDLPDVYLGPGNWWITGWMGRPLTEGQWYWDATTTVTGSEACWQNPSGGFGVGTALIPVQNVMGAPARDLAFRIEGRLAGQPAVPEAGSLVLAMSGLPAVAILIRRRRR